METSLTEERSARDAFEGTEKEGSGQSSSFSTFDGTRMYMFLWAQ